MPQISLYVKQKQYDLIEKGAKAAGKSVSSWVLELIMPQIDSNYSQEFLDLFGSVQDPTFKRPEQGDFSADAKRETL